MFTLTPKQEEARAKISALAGKKFSRPYVFRLRGYAGTGKTTTLKSLYESVGNFISVAPTGKAVVRIMETTQQPASTIHRWLYSAMVDPSTGELRLVKKSLEQMDVPPSRLIIIDESSMVSQELWEDLYDVCTALSINIVLVGDGFQLPPVVLGGENYFNVMDDAFMCDDGVDLTEVMRQALESPIIRSSMEIRNGNVFEGLYDIKRVLPRNLVDEAIQTNANKGVVICHKNATRHELNRLVREKMFGQEAEPLLQDEPLLVLKNNYKLNVFNGETFKFDSWVHRPNTKIDVINFFRKAQATVTVGVAKVQDLESECVIAPEELVGSADIDKVGPEAIGGKVQKHYGKSGPAYLSVNYGYTLTAHKSQGSEWNKVIVVAEPSVAINSVFGRRWLYTAVTRAKEDLSVCFLTKNDLQR